MATRQEVQHGKRLQEPIQLTAQNVNLDPKDPRDVELTATDRNGGRVEVVLWKTHGLGQRWNVDGVYEFSGVRGKRYSTSDGERVVLHSTSATEVRTVDPNQSANLFVLGDTHVGYRHRPQSEKAKWAKDVDCREEFARSLQRARNQGVAAVVHAGDVFDHGSTEADRAVVEREIRRTVDAGIPFYYVYGNHDDEEGRRLLDSSPATHLPSNPVQGGEQPVNLLGVDHSGRAFPSQPIETAGVNARYRTVLVIHESPDPVVDDSGNLLYQNDKNRADISQFIEAAPFDIDLVITGHLHVAERATVRGTATPVLVTGPTAPISKYENESRPSTWQCTVTRDRVELARQHLPGR